MKKNIYNFKLIKPAFNITLFTLNIRDYMQTISREYLANPIHCSIHFKGRECILSPLLYFTLYFTLYSTLYCTVLYCTVLYCTLQYSNVHVGSNGYPKVQYCTVLFCTVLYCTVLYCCSLPGVHVVLQGFVIGSNGHTKVQYCTVVYCNVVLYLVFMSSCKGSQLGVMDIPRLCSQVLFFPDGPPVLTRFNKKNNTVVFKMLELLISQL